RFIELAGGSDARIVVISTASSLGEEATGLYRELFTHVGAGIVSGLRPVTREEANSASAAATVDEATGVFLTGGNQLRLAAVVGGTELGAALLRLHERGGVIAGTSAGASAVSSHMMAFGASGATPKHRMAQISVGLGILKDIVVDQHFEQRTRLGRLLSAVAQSPSMIGLGLDEDTAAIVHSDQTLEVLGRGAVTIVDGSQVVTDSYQTKGHRPMMVSGAILHSLPSGYRFDLATRSLITHPSEARVRLPREAETARRRLARLSREIAAEGADSFVVERKGQKAKKQLPEASE
ncbi:MAG: cyanophycinase, partial [Actinobacteria bacterium]